MNVDYITNDNTIIFSPKFDKPLNHKLLFKYKKIIFSDYELTEDLFDVYENNKFNELNYICSKFNHFLSNSLDNLSSLTHLTFGCCFNQPLDNSLKNLKSLTHLTFNEDFNQPLVKSFDNLSSLTHLTFNKDFNQPLNNSLDNLLSLTHLTFGCCFNQPLSNSLDKLTSLTHLTFGLPRKL